MPQNIWINSSINPTDSAQEVFNSDYNFNLHGPRAKIKSNLTKSKTLFYLGWLQLLKIE